MADIYWGFWVIGIATLLAFAFGLWVTGKCRWWIRDLCAITTVAMMVGYIHYLWDNIWITKFLPYSNVVILGNWFPILAGLLAGIAWHRVPGHPARKAFSVAALMVAAAYAMAFPVLGEPPDCDNEWKHGVCLQTSPKTCSPAAAATLLSVYGIAASEQEMAELCLTRDGTTWAGLYHGLCVKTEGTEWKPEVFVWPKSQLRQMTDRAVILSVELKEGVEAAPIYTEEWGWMPGVPHSVVAFGFVHPHILQVGDPSVGLEPWSSADIRLLWHGKGMRLIRRDGGVGNADGD